MAKKKSGPNIATKIGAQPNHIKIAILVGVLVVVGFAYWQLFYSSMSEEYKGLKTKYSKLEKENANLKDREKEYKELIKRKSETDEALKKNRLSLPATADLPSFIGNLQSKAAASGVRIDDLKVEKEKVEAEYVRVPITVEANGDFYQIMKYMALLFDTKRIITVENIELRNPKSKKAGGDDGALVAKFQATTFRQPDGAEPAKTTKQSESKPKSKAQEARDKRQKDLDASAGIKEGSKESGTNEETQSNKSGLNRLKGSGAPQ